MTVIGSQGPSGTSAAAATRSMMKAYLDEIVAGPRGEFAEYFTDDVVMQIVGTDHEGRGRAAVEGMIRYFQEQAFDARPEIRCLLVDGNRAAIDADFVGQHIGEFAGRAATGKRFRVPFMLFYEVADTRIKSLRISNLLDELLRQLDG
ncbi:MAG: nuclear transport factor 2 family protein [Chloroflexi bacterium]|nr:nuclear transport factor 2 family protein [Chloroflexota bacterium]